MFAAVYKTNQNIAYQYKIFIVSKAPPRLCQYSSRLGFWWAPSEIQQPILKFFGLHRKYNILLGTKIMTEAIHSGAQYV